MSSLANTEAEKKEILYYNSLKAARLGAMAREKVDYRDPKDKINKDEDTRKRSYAGRMSGIIGNVSTGNTLGSFKEVVKLAKKMRDDADKHMTTPWIIALVLAFFKDTAGDISVILGWVMAIGFFIFLWGRGRLKYRIIRFILITLDIVPGLSLIPLTTGAVLFCWHESNKGYEENKVKLKEMEEKYGKKIHDYNEE